MMVNTTKACRSVVSEDCVRTQSPDGCVVQTIDATVDIDTPGKRAAHIAQQEQSRLMAVILGPLLACKQQRSMWAG